MALAGLPLIATKWNESKKAIVAPVSDDCGTLVGQPALLRKPGARTVLQRFDLFARDLQRGAGLTFHDSPLLWRAAWHAMPRRGASLRGVFAPFLAKAKISRGLSLSTGATRHPSDRGSGAS